MSFLRFVCPQHLLERLHLVSRVGLLGLFPIIVQQWMDPQAWKLHFMGPLELSCWQKTDWLNLNHYDLCDSAHSGWIGRNHQKEIGLWSVRALDYCRQGQCLSRTQHLCRTSVCSTASLGMHVPLTFFFFSNLAIHNWQGYTIYIYNASIVLQQYQIFSNFNFLNDYQRWNVSERWINMRPTPVRDPSWLK